MKNSKNYTLLIFLAVASQLAGCKNETEKKTAEVEKELQYVVEVEAIDYDFIMPSEIKSGWVTFDFKNSGQKEHFGMLLKFNTPLEIEDKKNYVEERTDENFYKLIGEDSLTVVGGPGFHTQGQKSKMTLFLEPGDYLMTCNTITAEGTPHYELGMDKFLKVIDKGSDSRAPDHDLELTLTKYIIETEGEIKSGRQTVAIDHAGGDSFDIHLVKLNDTSNIATTLEFMDNITSPSKVIFLGGAEQKEVKNKSYITKDFEPGRYAWVSHEYGAMGMIKEFTIPENGNSKDLNSSSIVNPQVVNFWISDNSILVQKILESGPLKFVLNNSSNEVHKIGLARLKEDKYLQDYKDFIDQWIKEPDIDKIDNPTTGYSTYFEEGAELKMNLRPGIYIVFCDAENSDVKYHASEGEVASFRVK